jgi:extradiol dioxygenase family protein
VEPVLHLSLAVHDLAAAQAFYVDALGCRLGRVRDGWIDVWFYGMQVTLHEVPASRTQPDAVRHFGVTLSLDELRSLLSSLEGRNIAWISRVHTDFAGTPREQTKAKLADPSGNVIELKAYADRTTAFSN